MPESPDTLAVRRPQFRTRPKPRAKAKRKTPAPAQATRRAASDISAGAAAVKRGAEAGPIHRALTAPRVKPRRRGGLLANIERGAGRMVGSYKGDYETVKAAAQAVAPSTARARRFVKFAETPGPNKYEKTAEVTVGKSAANLAFHGETSHLPEAGLEIGAMLPLIRGARAVGAAGKAAKAARGARGAEQGVLFPTGRNVTRT